jgi:hypothetical protein
MLEREGREKDKHGEANKRIFVILFFASMLKITQKSRQYEDGSGVSGVTSINIVHVHVQQRVDSVRYNIGIIHR